MSTNIVVIFVHQYVKILTILLSFSFYHMGFFKDSCERSIPFSLCTRDSVHSHLRHTDGQWPFANFFGGGVFEQWPFSMEEVGFLF